MADLLSNQQAAIGQLTRRLAQVEGQNAAASTLTTTSTTSAANTSTSVVSTKQFKTLTTPVMLFNAIITGPASAWNTINVSSYVPASATSVAMTWELSANTGTGAITVNSRQTMGYAGFTVLNLNSVVTAVANPYFTMVDLTGAQTFDYQANIPVGSTGTLIIVLVGYFG